VIVSIRNPYSKYAPGSREAISIRILFEPESGSYALEKKLGREAMSWQRRRRVSSRRKACWTRSLLAATGTPP